MDSQEAKQAIRCAVHHFGMPGDLCSCPHDCDNCGVTYVGEHSKDDCITVFKRRLRLDELSATITALSAGRESMSNEELVAAARADLLASLKPSTPSITAWMKREDGTISEAGFQYLQVAQKEPQCAGPFVDAWDCPVHDPRKAQPSAPATEQTHTECNSRAGIVCGLVDGVIAIARIWNQYIDHPMPDDPAVIAAFKDMRADKDVREFFGISEFEALTADFRADFPTSKPSAPATEPDKWNDAKPCGLSGNWCFVHHCYPNTCKIMGLGEYTKPPADKCLATSKYGCICLLDAGHEGKHDSKCGWNHNKWEGAPEWP